MKLIISALAAFAAAIAAANAAPQASRFSYETTYFPKTDESGDRMEFVSASGIALDGKFSVWYLLGEPVINCTARWTNAGRESMVIDPLGDGARIIEPAQEGEIEIYNLLLAASGPDPRDAKYGFGSAKTIAVPCDAGIVAQNGRDGFNVAGSPSWDKFLCALPDAGVRFQGVNAGNKDHCLAMNGKWLSAAEAKAIAISGLNLDEVVALKASINGAAIVKRAEKRQWREKSAAFKQERTAAMLGRMRVRDGETPLDLIERRSQADRRLPKLPTKDPSAEQLAAYEAAWREVTADLADVDKTFTDEWRAKEKALVGEQLERLKKLDKRAAKEEERYFNYLQSLNALKKNEPVEPDPMAAYRTDAPLTAYIEGSDSNRVCGLKRPDGSVAIPGAYYRPYYGGCPVQAVAGYDIYKAAIEARHPTLGPQGLLANDAVCTYESGCAIYYDRDGNVLHKAGIEVYPSTESSNLAFSYGLIVANRERGGMYVYSLLTKKVLLEPSTRVFPRQSGWSAERVSATALLRNGRPALRLSIHSSISEDLGCGPSHYVYAYLYIDTERVEEVGLCTKPDDDPLNQKIE